MNNKKIAVLSTALLVGFASVFAHTPYVEPNVFSTSKGKKVTAVSSFTDEFFVPEFKVESDDFHLVLPDGTRSEFGNVTVLDQMTIVENSLEDEGTYRLSTGNRLGRKFEMKAVDGGWDYIRGGMGEGGEREVIPEGVKTAKFQSQTVAVAYVSKGAPSDEVLKQVGEGLEIVPITHPSEIYADEGFKFRLTFNGAPLANHEVSAYRGGAMYEENEYEEIVTTNRKGNASLEFDRPGVYLIMTRHQDVAPEDSSTPYRSYTISLTFEVQR